MTITPTCEKKYHQLNAEEECSICYLELNGKVNSLVGHILPTGTKHLWHSTCGQLPLG